MRGTAMGKEAEIKTDSRTDLAVAHDDSVVFSAWPRCQSRAVVGKRARFRRRIWPMARHLDRASEYVPKVLVE